MEETLSCDAVEDRGLVERYLAGTLSESETEVFESHYLTCARCQKELRLGAGIRKVLLEVRRAEESKGSTIAAPTRHWFHRPARVGAAAAAVAAVLIGVLLVQPADRGTLPHREGVPASEVAVPTVQAPVGETRALEEFRWERVSAADLYRVTLFDAEGQVLWQEETRETHLPQPDTLQLESHTLYLWQVDARVGWDRWVSSELVRFQISEPSSVREP